MRRESIFAASTVAATAWLIAFHPERLRGWLDRHPYGRDLEVETREFIAEEKAARKAHKGAPA